MSYHGLEYNYCICFEMFRVKWVKCMWHDLSLSWWKSRTGGRFGRTSCLHVQMQFLPPLVFWSRYLKWQAVVTVTLFQSILQYCCLYYIPSSFDVALWRLCCMHRSWAQPCAHSYIQGRDRIALFLLHLCCTQRCDHSSYNRRFHTHATINVHPSLFHVPLARFASDRAKVAIFLFELLSGFTLSGIPPGDLTDRFLW